MLSTSRGDVTVAKYEVGWGNLQLHEQGMKYQTEKEKRKRESNKNYDPNSSVVATFFETHSLFMSYPDSRHKSTHTVASDQQEKQIQNPRSVILLV